MSDVRGSSLGCPLSEQVWGPVAQTGPNHLQDRTALFGYLFNGCGILAMRISLSLGKRGNILSAKWQQWMPLHIDRFLGSPAVQAMSPAAQMGYLRLLMASWQSEDCTISSDPLDLAETSGLGDDLWEKCGARILRKFFPVSGNGRLRNSVCYEEWREAKRIFEARKAAAIKTTEIRSPRLFSTVTEDNQDGDHTVTNGSPSRSANTITGTLTNTKKQTASAGEEIDALYKAYPRHTAPKAARKAIEKALKEKPFDVLLPIVQAYAAQTAKRIADGKLEKEFIPHPATWFNQGRYEDDDLKPPPQYDIVEVSPQEFWKDTGIHVS